MTSVIIIGAGAAGLAAARSLTKQHVDVTVLEARDRIGGRIHTLHDDSLTIELGAEFIHGKHPALMEILDAASLPVSDVTQRHWFIDEGRISTSHEFWNKLTALMDLMDDKKPDQTFQSFLNNIPDTPEVKRAKEAATLFVEGFHAAESQRIGVHGLVKANEAEDSIDGEHDSRVVDGYERLMQVMHEEAVKAGCAFHLNTVVSEVDWGKNGVEVVCEDNQRFSAECVIVTLPLGVLQHGSITFNPELPERTQDAIANLAMGHVVRVTLRFRERFWERLKLPTKEHLELPELGFIHCPDAPLPTWWTLSPIHAPILVGWTGGANAIKIRNALTSNYNEGVLEIGLNSLRQIFGVSASGLRDQLVSYHAHDWTGDPFSRGAYSYLPVNGLPAQETLSQPIDGVLFFAGEATSAGHVGTVHGAIDSGQRAARQILER